MSGERERQVGRGHAAAVIGHADQAAAAVGDDDLDPAGAGVERILDQFLDGGGGAFDHLSGGDTVHRGLVKLADDGAGRGGNLRDLGVGDGHAARCSMTVRDSASDYSEVRPTGWPTTTKCRPSERSSSAATRAMSSCVTASI